MKYRKIAIAHPSTPPPQTTSSPAIDGILPRG